MHYLKHDSEGNWIIIDVNNEQGSTIQVHYHCSLAIKFNSNQNEFLPHVAFKSGGNQLSYTTWIPELQYWTTTVIDPSTENGDFPDITFDTESNIHISYFDDAGKDLKYAFFDGVAWAIEVIDEPGDVGYWSQIELDDNDIPHITYYDNTNQQLKHAVVTPAY
ncbi:MAG: hypothetical protein K8R74_13690 [Bacteroidales bacterium]|nr:hypothetical protein [Bacteroidales bacterium]